MSDPKGTREPDPYNDRAEFWDEITRMSLREMQEKRAREHEEWIARMKAMGLL